tara:strand:+ start:400 stop:984 length:585 start_codon:yes stop_codon:yes gene_type:complete
MYSSNPNIPLQPKRKTSPKRKKPPTPDKKKGPPSRKNRGPPERRRLPAWNPQDDSHIFSTTIPIKEAQEKEEERKRIYASKKHGMPLISLPEARLRENKRKVENFAKDNINYNPNRNFPQRENDSAILANKRPPRRNKTRKNKTMRKSDTSLKALKHRPPGMGGRRKTRRKKRRKTKTKKKRRRKRRKTRRKKR